MITCVFLVLVLSETINSQGYVGFEWQNLTMYDRIGESVTLPFPYSLTPAYADPKWEVTYQVWDPHTNGNHPPALAGGSSDAVSLINVPGVEIPNVTADMLGELIFTMSVLGNLGDEDVHKATNITLIDTDTITPGLLSRLAEIESQVNVKNNKISNLNASLKSLEDGPNQMISEPVAFYTRLFKYSTFVGKDNHFIFSYVDFNKGDGYNSSSGYFTVPISGYYYFAATTGGRHGYVGIYIAVDDVPVSNSSDTLVSRGWTEHTNTFLTSYVTAGQRVSVHTQSQAYYYRGDSSFMGFLISTNGNQNLDG